MTIRIHLDASTIEKGCLKALPKTIGGNKTCRSPYGRRRGCHSSSITSLGADRSTQVTLAAIKCYDDQIAELAENHADYKLFDCLPGAGPSLTPRLLVAFAGQRDRFTNASELQTYSGIAPVTERSGKKCWVHWRWSCPNFLRQTFTERASQTIKKSFWAGAFYRQ